MLGKGGVLCAVLLVFVCGCSGSPGPDAHARAAASLGWHVANEAVAPVPYREVVEAHSAAPAAPLVCGPGGCSPGATATDSPSRRAGCAAPLRRPGPIRRLVGRLLRR